MDGQARARLSPGLRNREDFARKADWRRQLGFLSNRAGQFRALKDNPPTTTFEGARLSMHSPRSGGARATSLLMLSACCAFAGTNAIAQTPAPGAKPVLTLEDLYSEYNVIDAAISPSGKMIAAAIRREHAFSHARKMIAAAIRREADDVLVVLDLATGQKRPVTRLNKDAFGDQID